MKLDRVRSAAGGRALGAAACASRRAASTLRRSALAMLVGCALPAQAEVCDSWPGEPEPLPTTQSTNDFAAVWARTRAEQLTELARRLQTADPAAARALLEHASCMTMEGSTGDVTLRALLPAQTAAPRPALRTYARSALERADGELTAIRAALDAARFRSALERARELMTELEADAQIPAVRTRMADLAVLAATVHTALGEIDEAELSLRRARSLVPSYRLTDAAPPKLRRLWDQLANAPVGSNR